MVVVVFLKVDLLFNLLILIFDNEKKGGFWCGKGASI